MSTRRPSGEIDRPLVNFAGGLGSVSIITLHALITPTPSAQTPLCHLPPSAVALPFGSTLSVDRERDNDPQVLAPRRNWCGKRIGSVRGEHLDHTRDAPVLTGCL